MIVAALNQSKLDELYNIALEYKMSVIIEVHTVEEAKRVSSFNNAIIGINNRNLSIDPLVPDQCFEFFGKF